MNKLGHLFTFIGCFLFEVTNLWSIGMLNLPGFDFPKS